MRTLAIIAAALLLAACGSPEGAGTYVVDADAMGQEIERQVGKMLEGQLGRLTGIAKDAPNEAKEAARERLRERFPFEAVLADDGTFVMRERGETAASGTWTLEAGKLTLVVTEGYGKALWRPRTITGSYDDGRIRFRPEPGLPFDIVMRRK